MTETAFVSTDQMFNLVATLEPTLKQYEVEVVVASCLAIAIMLQESVLTMGQLMDGVKVASEAITDYLNDLGSGSSEAAADEVPFSAPLDAPVVES